MSGSPRDDLSPLQRAALAMREMRLRLDRVEGERREPIAIVGVGCRFPGGVATPDDFWTLLRSGRDAVSECPRDRWDVDRYYDADPDRAGTIYTRHGSFLDRIDGFDARFFDISAREAESLDPQQRLLLEVAWEALEHGGVAPDALRGTRTGVFVGIGQNDYARRRLLSGTVDQIGPYDGTGNGFCFAAGRLSYCLGLQGPNMAIDTACSASLVSVHLACQSLRLRECDLALAGGVQLMLSPEVTVFLCRARALSADGRCRTFDARANGYGRGEGCGIAVLKRLSDALRDRDNILAVLRGSAINHDGPSSGFTVPSAPAQQRLIREALDRAGLQPGDIDYLEVHGTATSLGDPIEIAGLEGVFARRPPNDPLRIGSVKTNIGHLEAAAGIAGLIKVVLALQHAEIPPHLHFETPNPAVRWSELPFRVTSRLEPWSPGPRVRRAGVSSFGISGTNAHVVVEEAPRAPSVPRPGAAGPCVLRIAARSEAALQALAGRYAAHVTMHPEQPLADICFTANTGRAEGSERAAVVAEDRTELAAGLAALARGDTKPPRVVRGRATERGRAGAGISAGVRPRAEIAAPDAGEARVAWMQRMAASYVAGVSVDWTVVDPAAEPRRVALPTYPWQHQRYWIDSTDHGPAPRAPAPSGALHPLLHRRVSSPVRRTDIEFETTLDGSSALAADHRWLGTPVVPAGAFMEMALAAARAAGQGDACSIEHCTFHQSLELPRQPVTLRLVLTPAASGSFAFEIHSELPGNEQLWTRHVSGRVTNARAPQPPPLHLDALLERMGDPVPSRDLYASLRSRGLDLGRSFQVLGEVRHGRDEALARLERRADAAWIVDPALLDGCSALHAVLQETSSGLWVQGHVARLTFHSALSDVCWAYLRRNTEVGSGDILLLDAAGRVVLEVSGQQLHPVGFARDPGQAPVMPLYELAWVAAPNARVDRIRATEDDARYREAERELESLSTDFIGAALGQLGAGPLPDHVDVADLARHLGVVPRHHRLLQRMLQILPPDRRQPGTATGDLPARLRAAAARYPIAAVEFELLGRCGSNLPAVLRGHLEPLSLLFPDGGVSAAALYSDSHAARVMNDLLRSAVARLLASWPGTRPLRVLEAGAGTGATTEVLLNALPSQAEYWFTDIAPVFVQQGRAHFGEGGTVRYRQFDIERPGDEQGVERESFDLVVASNVLHATRSLSGTLANVRQLLRPGGTLLLMEGTAPRAWLDLIFGLTEGWWLFSDVETRASHPLVSVAEWRTLLGRAGFDAADVWPDSDEPGPAGQAVIVTSRPAAGEEARALDAGAAARPSRGRRWIVVGDEAGAARHVADALGRRGARCDIVSGSLRDAILAHDHADLGVVRLPVEVSALTDAGDTALRALSEARHAVSLIQHVASLRKTCPIWFVTRNVHGATDGTADPSGSAALSQAPLWGIARTLALEEPTLWGGVIDVDARDWPAAAEHIAAELLDEPRDEGQAVYRGGVRLVPRVRAIASAASMRPSLSEGTYLITGGLGAFGLATAEFLASRGARQLCLTGRHGAASELARAGLARLERMGVTPLVFAADVTSEPEMRAVIAAVQSSPLPLRGVIHAAGVTGIGLLRDAAPASIAEILRPKVIGGWLLHRLTEDIELQFFLCYSSMVSVWGARGQGLYVAANHFLDALAHHRRARGLPAVTVNWGPLGGAGMVPQALTGELLRMGVTTTPMREAAGVLDRVLDGRHAQPIAVDIDWTRFRELYGLRRRASMFDLVHSAPAAGPATDLPAGREAVLRALPGQRRDVLLDQLRDLLGRVITASGPIDSTTGLFDLGLDSLSAMELRRLLEQRFGVTLPSTVLFDCGTLEALTDDMLVRLGLEAPAGQAMLDTLSEDVLEARLLEKLRELN